MSIRFLTMPAVVILTSLVACDARKTSFSFSEPLTTSSATTSIRFNADDAVQGVAVDGSYLYAISNSRISKHRKHDGALVQRWSQKAVDELAITHLNSAVVHEKQLYAAHSNWPHTDIRNSIEVWTTDKLKHIATTAISNNETYLTWLDYHRGSWWAAFVDYPTAQHNFSQRNFSDLRTRVVQMDESFRVLKRYRLPVALLQRLYPMSNSGASWGTDDRLYLTGHDHPELYVMSLPPIGNTLKWVETISWQEIKGQGISWDRFAMEPRLFGIRRSSREIVGMRPQEP